MSATEGMHGHTQASSNFQANGAPIPWAEVCRHPAFPPSGDTAVEPDMRASESRLFCFFVFVSSYRFVPAHTLRISQIFSRHEAVLVSHLEMLESVKGQVAPDGEALRTISSMVAKTTQAINQSKVARKQAVCGFFPDI